VLTRLYCRSEIPMIRTVGFRTVDLLYFLWRVAAWQLVFAPPLLFFFRTFSSTLTVCTMYSLSAITFLNGVTPVLIAVSPGDERHTWSTFCRRRVSYATSITLFQRTCLAVRASSNNLVQIVRAKINFFERGSGVNVAGGRGNTSSRTRRKAMKSRLD